VSMDGKGRWLDNVFLERLRPSVKHEGVYLWAPRDMHELECLMGKWFADYNQLKPHKAPGRFDAVESVPTRGYQAMGEGRMRAYRDSETEEARAQAFGGFCHSATLHGCKPPNARNVARENKPNQPHPSCQGAPGLDVQRLDPRRFQPALHRIGNEGCRPSGSGGNRDEHSLQVCGTPPL
jgi:hypothetical protein